MRLFIAEKPSMAMDIAKAIGRFERKNGYFVIGDDCVAFAVGHLIGQASPEAYGEQYAKDKPWIFETLPIVPSKWVSEVYPKTKDQLQTIGALLKSAKSVVHAGDSAREGQMIVDEILDHFSYRGPVERLWLQSMTTESIRAAMKRMKNNSEYKALYAGAQARSRMDWLVGMNLTRAFSIPWKRSGHEGAVHIGRVKTPTMCMVVERDLLIENFVPKTYYVLRARIEHPNGSFLATWTPSSTAAFLDADGYLTDSMIAESMVAFFGDMPAEISRYESKEKQTPPPLPYSLGDLQKDANRLLGLTPSQTLDMAQSLYEKHKLTSYPRTDYNHLPEEEHKLASKFIDAAKSIFGESWPFVGTPDYTIKSAAWDSSKIGDHFAIRPTETSNYSLAALSATELKVYTLIVRRFLAQFYPRYRYQSTLVSVDCEGEKLNATGAVEIDAGWKVLFRGDQGGDEDAGQPLPKMAVDDLVVIGKVDVDEKKTSPPARFTGATIIEAMEKAHLYVSDEKLKTTMKGLGIGTPATRANIVDELVKQGYLSEEKKGKQSFYLSSSKARQVFQFIPADMRKPDGTALIEESLKKIEDGEIGMEAVLNHHVADIQRKIGAAKNLSLPKNTEHGKQQKGVTGSLVCPKCGSPLKQRTSAKGPFLGCSAYPECRHTENIPAQQKQSPATIQKKTTAKKMTPKQK